MKKRILSILIIFSIVITAITSVICCSVYYRFYKDTVHDELKAKTIMLTESLNDIANNVKTLENIEKSGQIDFRITYILKDGRVAYDNTADIKAMENHSERIEFREAIKTGSGENLRRSESLNKDTYYYALRLQDGSVIRLSKEMDSVFSVFNTTIPIILAFLIILIICSIIISSILTKKILAPINKASEFIDNQNIVISDDFNCYDELLPFINQIRHLNFEDIKKRTELEKERSTLDVIIENMSEGLIFLDNEKKVIAINKSAGDMLEVGNAGYKNVNILNISRSGELQKAINYVLENKKTYEFEVEKNKSFYKYFVCPVKNNKKEVSGIMIFIMDTTLKMLNEKMRSEFTANVSHELKTPLTSISGYAELMGQGMVKTDGDLQKIGKTIYKESARMIELVNDIMRLSQIETAVDLTDFHPVNVKPVIEDAVLTLENIAAKKEVEIECNISDAVISADKNLFFEMIYNLISNAIQYNKPSGKVNIKSNVKNDKLEITVSDTGIGIEKEHINRIFERFYRVDKSRSKQTGGTGLGLSIVKHIVNIHKGEISVSSEIERGTKITLVFPAVNEV